MTHAPYPPAKTAAAVPSLGRLGGVLRSGLTKAFARPAVAPAVPAAAPATAKAVQAAPAVGKAVQAAPGAAPAAKPGMFHSTTLGGNAVTHGMGKMVKDYGMGGAMFGGGLGGIFGAIGAEDGHRLEGFGRGAVSGAVEGAAAGALSGVVSAPLRNARQIGLNRMTKSPEIAASTVNDSWSNNLRTAIGAGANKSRPAINAARVEALAAPAAFAADFYIGDKVLQAGKGALGLEETAPMPPAPPVNINDARRAAYPPPRQYAPYDAPYPQHLQRTASVAPEHKDGYIEPLYATPVTGTLGAVAVDHAIQTYRPDMPMGHMRRRILPAMGAAALSVPAIMGLRAYNADKITNPLDDIDLSSLKSIFGKQPATHELGEQHANRNH